MGNRRLYEIEGIHMLGASESERLMVAALNLFHPTASPLSKEVVFPFCDTASDGGESACLPVGRGGGGQDVLRPTFILPRKGGGTIVGVDAVIGHSNLFGY